METLKELEAQFENQKPESFTMLVTHDKRQSLISNLIRGNDFLAGIEGSGAIAIPFHAISHCLGANLPDQIETNLNQFLSMQRTPVRLEYQSGEVVTRCWLLNVLEDWLRVATNEGVGWIPIQSLRLVRIDPVDN